MTNMKRMTISFPDEIVDELERQKRTERFAGRSYSKMILFFLELGIRSDVPAEGGEQEKDTDPQ